MISEVNRSPLARTRKRHATRGLPTGIGIFLCNCCDGGIGIGIVGPHCAKNIAHIRRTRNQCRHISSGKVHQSAHVHSRIGQRSRFIRADRVHPGQGFHGGKFLHEHAFARKANHGNRHGDAGEKDQPLGHHGDHSGDGSAQRIAPGQISFYKLRIEQQATHWNECEGYVADESRNRIA